MSRTVSANRLSRLAQRGALLIFLSAILPNLLFLGHWGLLVSAEGHSHGPAEAQAHVEHCHLDVTHCGGQPSLTGVWGLDPQERLLLPAGLTPPVVLAIAHTLSFDEPELAVLRPPPRLA